MAPSAGTLRVGRYFAVLIGLFIVLFGVVFWPGQSRTPKLGLDLEGGAQVILKAQTITGNKTPSKSAMDQARQIITDRVNGLGVSSAEVVTQGSDRIVVSIPGKGVDSLKDIGTTALLNFRPLLLQAVPVQAATPSGSATPSAGATGSASATAKATGTAKATATASAKASTSPSPRGRVVPLAAGSTPVTAASPSATPSPTAKATGSATATPSASASPLDTSAPIDQWKIVGFTPPSTPAAVAALPTAQAQALQSAIQSWPCSSTVKPLDDPAKPMITCDEAGQNKYLLGPVIVKGTEIKDAQANAPGSTQGQLSWTVSLNLKPAGQSAWAAYTSKHNVTVDSTDIGNTVADTLDSRVIVASTIQSTINGTTEISGGNFTEQSATNLANSLKYGALPLNFTELTNTRVSPTLGTDQLKAGLLAGGIGLALVVVYSLIYYRALGLVTIASLVVSGGLTYAMLVILGKQIGFTLTLAGIAGFIVAVGITADSFVVFFERIKDEVHSGRTPRAAIPRAWERSRRTILSADTVSFLAAATLYYFAAGEVRGFAFTLGLSTVLDLVVVFLFTHPLVSLFSRSAAFGSPRFTGLNHVRATARLSTDPAYAGVPSDVVYAGAPAGDDAAAEPVAERPARPARSRTRPTGGVRLDKADTAVTDPPSPVAPAGATAAERAAARRGLQRNQDTDTEDNG